MGSQCPVAAAVVPLPSAQEAAAEAVVMFSALWVRRNSPRGRAGTAHWVPSVSRSACGVREGHYGIFCFVASSNPKRNIKVCAEGSALKSLSTVESSYIAEILKTAVPH